MLSPCSLQKGLATTDPKPVLIVQILLGGWSSRRWGVFTARRFIRGGRAHQGSRLPQQQRRFLLRATHWPRANQEIKWHRCDENSQSERFLRTFKMHEKWQLAAKGSIKFMLRVAAFSPGGRWCVECLKRRLALEFDVTHATCHMPVYVLVS